MTPNLGDRLAAARARLARLGAHVDPDPPLDLAYVEHEEHRAHLLADLLNPGRPGTC